MATDALIYLKVTTLKGLDTVEVRSSSLLVPTIFFNNFRQNVGTEAFCVGTVWEHFAVHSAASGCGLRLNSTSTALRWAMRLFSMRACV